MSTSNTSAFVECCVDGRGSVAVLCSDVLIDASFVCREGREDSSSGFRRPREDHHVLHCLFCWRLIGRLRDAAFASGLLPLLQPPCRVRRRHSPKLLGIWTSTQRSYCSRRHNSASTLEGDVSLPAVEMRNRHLYNFFRRQLQIDQRMSHCACCDNRPSAGREVLEAVFCATFARPTDICSRFDAPFLRPTKCLCTSLTIRPVDKSSYSTRLLMDHSAELTVLYLRLPDEHGLWYAGCRPAHEPHVYSCIM